MTATRMRIAATAVFVVLGLLVSVQVASADTTTSGTPAAQQAATTNTLTSDATSTSVTDAPGGNATTGEATAGTTETGSSDTSSSTDSGTAADGDPGVTDGAANGVTDGSTDGANGPNDGTSITVTFEGTFDDVKALADAIQNDPFNTVDSTDQGGVDGTGDGEPIDPGTDPSSNSQTAQASAASTQRNAGNANVSVRVHQPGTTGAVTQTNAVVSEAHAKTSSNSGSGTAGNAETNASASADASQNAASNTNVNVLVDSAGDIGDTTQTNGVYAGAAATGTTSGTTGTAGAGTNGGAAIGSTGNGATTTTSGGSTAGDAPVGDAHAKATQSGASNVNVSVRINSPGNNGAVNQSNTVAAEAGQNIAGGTTGSAGAGAPSDPFETDQGHITSGSADASNNGDLGQQIEQTEDSQGRPGEATRPGSSSVPAAGLTNGTAAASQSGALNANVSVRVGSPGSDGPVQQGNTATATGTSASNSMVTVTGGSNVNVAIAVPGASGAPNGAWTWNWDWDGAWTLPPVPGPDVAPTASSIWDWMWQTGAGGAATSGTSAPAPATTTTASSSAPYGTWTWNWTWVFADGTSWQFNQTQACECAWDWNWTWDWAHQNPAMPAPTATAAADGATTDDTAAAFDPATDTGDVFQSNTVSAHATATVELAQLSETDVTQSDTTGETQDSLIDQRLINSQTAKAMSEAAQNDAWNINLVWGVPVESVRQSNDADATASATVTARVAQGIVQEQVGNGTTDQAATAQQWLLNSQLAVAATQTAQTRARNINKVEAPSPKHAAVAAVQQSNGAHGSASVSVDTEVAQWIGQFQNAGASDSQEAVAEQLHINQQDGVSFSQVAQSGTTNLNNLDVPAGSRATNPSVGQRNEATVTTTAADSSSIDGWIHQAQGGVADIEQAAARQEGIVNQSNSASAPATQSELLNAAAWNGVEPPADPTDEAPGRRPRRRRPRRRRPRRRRPWRRRHEPGRPEQPRRLGHPRRRHRLSARHDVGHPEELHRLPDRRQRLGSPGRLASRPDRRLDAGRSPRPAGRPVRTAERPELVTEHHTFRRQQQRRAGRPWPERAAAVGTAGPDPAAAQRRRGYGPVPHQGRVGPAQVARQWNAASASRSRRLVGPRFVQSCACAPPGRRQRTGRTGARPLRACHPGSRGTATVHPDPWAIGDLCRAVGVAWIARPPGSQPRPRSWGSGGDNTRQYQTQRNARKGELP